MKVEVHFPENYGSKEGQRVARAPQESWSGGDSRRDVEREWSRMATGKKQDGPQEEERGGNGV